MLIEGVKRIYRLPHDERIAINAGNALTCLSWGQNPKACLLPTS
jgi:hypothetical protein